ncbi:unnamed protein product [Colias eurytheme]|nr:unnamed protein product [Colias eurytheme]
MTFHEDHDRTLPYLMDTFTFRGPAILPGAPFSITEFMHFNEAYQQFLASIRNLDLTFLNEKACPVCYSFDATRPEGDRLLINWD